jgi:hypothetical protein
MFFGIYFISCPLPIDMASLLVAVLSLLVTVLIGWNIFSVFDFKNKIEKNEITNNKIIKELESKILFHSDKAVLFEQKFKRFEFRMKGALLHLQGNNYIKSENYILAIFDFFSSIKFYYNGADFGNLNRILKVIKKYIHKITKEDLENLQKNRNFDVIQILNWLNEKDTQGVFTIYIVEIRTLINKITNN